MEYLLQIFHMTVARQCCVAVPPWNVRALALSFSGKRQRESRRVGIVRDIGIVREVPGLFEPHNSEEIIEAQDFEEAAPEAEPTALRVCEPHPHLPPVAARTARRAA